MHFFHQLRIALPLLAVLFLVGLSGCSDDGGDGSGTSGDAVEITFWHFWSEPTQRQHLLDQVKQFEEANPGIRVKLEELSWDQGKEKLMAAFSAGTAPDVLELGSDWVAKFSSAGVLADQSTMAGDSAARFSNEVVAPGLWENKVYAWPWIMATRAFFVNKGLLAQANYTGTGFASWAEVMNGSEAVTAAVGGNGNTFGFGANGPDAHRLYKKIVPFFWSNGGDILNAKGQPAINSPENIAALETYLALARSGKIETQKQLDEMFLQGRIAFWISGPWLVERIQSDNPELDYEVTLLPGFNGNPGVSFAGGEYLAISEQSDRKEEAKKLITFLTSPQQALAFGKELPGGFAPADLSVADDPALQEGWSGVFTKQLEHARMTPVHPKWLEIEEILEEEVSEALLGQKDATTSLNDAQFRVVGLLRE